MTDPKDKSLSDKPKPNFRNPNFWLLDLNYERSCFNCGNTPTISIDLINYNDKLHDRIDLCFRCVFIEDKDIDLKTESEPININSNNLQWFDEFGNKQPRGHHINEKGQFQSDKHPGLPPDKIVLSFDDRSARDALRFYARLIHKDNPKLAEDILHRLYTIYLEEVVDDYG